MFHDFVVCSRIYCKNTKIKHSKQPAHILHIAQVVTNKAYVVEVHG